MHPTRSCSVVLTVLMLLGSGAWAQNTADDLAQHPDFAKDIARSFLVSKGLPTPSAEQLTVATQDVQAMRDSGMGWGVIANTLGLRLGDVVSSANRSPKAKDGDTTTAANNRSPGSGQAGGSGGGNGSGNGGGNSGGGRGGGGGNGGNGGGRR